MILYRYLRPQHYNFDRNEAVTLKKGGICFRLETGEASTLMTYAMCHPADTFSKDVARKIADDRAQHRLGFYVPPDTMTIEVACAEALKLQGTYETLATGTEGARNLYLTAELPILRQRIQEILATHRAVNHLSQLDKDVIEGLNLRRLYEAAHG